MRKILISLGAAVTLWAAPLAGQEMIDAPYDLLFREGTLDQIGRDKALIYERDVVNALEPDTEARDTGRIELSFAEGDPVLAHLKFTQGGKYRNLGTFPASVGNPIIMYFVETVARDMAETAGGSPFYIRNRIKDSLVSPAEHAAHDVTVDGKAVAGEAVTLRPFKDDPNAEKMKGFDRLALEVTMSEDVPGWYHQLRAYVPGQTADAPIYSSVLTFDGMGGGE